MTILINTAIGTLQVDCVDKCIIRIAKVGNRVESGDKVEERIKEQEELEREMLEKNVIEQEGFIERVKEQEELEREMLEKNVIEQEGFIERIKEQEELEREIKRQFVEYFDGKRKEFELEFKLDGTPFQKKVWGELLKIPYGETITYAELAGRVGSPKGSRAVGNANGKNKILIVVPCHRVVAKGGIGGFACGSDVKKILLDLEKENK